MKFSRIFFAVVFLYLVYVALVLTNGYLPDFFGHINKGSTLYANMWEHFTQGDFFIDKEHTRMEYFVLGDNKFTIYYGFFPAFIRGFFDIFLSDIYKYNFNNLSIIAALGVAIIFLYRTFAKLDLFKGKVRIFSFMSLTALFLASPVCYIFSWGWMYNEPIMWGFAWTIGYIAVFFLWVFKPDEERNFKNGTLMGLCLSMAVLSRVIDAVIPFISFAFIVIKAVFDFFAKKDRTQVRMLSVGILLCLVFGSFVMKSNMDKWGSPFVFQEFDKNIQVIDNPIRLEGIKKEGLWNFKRIPASFLYYFVPSEQNFKADFPFIDVDRDLTIMKNRPYYDLIMSSRVPLTLSAFFLLFFALLGIYKLKEINKKEKLYLTPLIIGGIVQYLALLIYAGITLRYSMGFIFLLVVFNMIFLMAETRKEEFINRFSFLYSALAVLLVSVYINFFTMIAYKHYIWDISPNTKQVLGKIINYTPDENYLLFIKNHTDYQKFSP